MEEREYDIASFMTKNMQRNAHFDIFALTKIKCISFIKCLVISFETIFKISTHFFIEYFFSI